MRVTGLLAAVLVLLAGAGSADGQPSALRLQKVLSGLDAPVYVTAPRSEPGRLYVVERGGTVRVVERGRLRRTPFLDISAQVRAGGEQGLLGLAFAPDYATSRLLVVDYTDRDGNSRIVRYRSDGVRAVPDSARRLLLVRQPYPNHNGGMVAYGRDGKLYVGFGDGGSAGDPENRAQSMRTLLGKIVRLDPARPGARPLIVALGLRNPWRFSFDRANGDLYIGDVGQDAIEEVDHVAWPWNGLLNFGWDVYEGRSSFEPKPLGPGRLVQPVAQYSHARGCSITGGYVYRGTAVPSARGRYFYGDYCSGTIWSLTIAGAGARQVRREPISLEGLSSFGEDAAGELYAVSADSGTLFRLAS
ncbi:Glucose/sorbosone dehydrogenase [Gaiella occulta]|uniref:Glucose/sorbosone dehydrogenase n=1 Tax=Gaiella occulta TaxID=1002870 RepID=A0A7M2YTS6_9ACTN|nr:PQQ-dependent sugar dehydrogenase [Gaiella occulta]RDI73486.1 Glucose/sorbosone dehydrogenase [Gaiella occulta]